MDMQNRGLGAIQIICDTLGGEGGWFMKMSPNFTWGGGGLANVSRDNFNW